MLLFNIVFPGWTSCYTSFEVYEHKGGKNLNPFNEHDNIQLILALKKISLKEKKPRKM